MGVRPRRLGHLRPTHELYRVCVVDLLRAQRIQLVLFPSQTSGACLSDACVPLGARHLHRLRAPADRQYALDNADRKFGRIRPDRGGNPGLCSCSAITVLLAEEIDK